MTSTEQEKLDAIDAAADDILEAARRHAFAHALYGMVINLDAMFTYIEDMNPPPSVKRAYQDLHGLLKAFACTGLPALVRVEGFRREEIN